MNKKLQVFVSSTFTDMREERQAAVEAILRAGHIPAGMELFAAGDESQWETIKHWIDDSDVFMLILGGRYGSIEPKSERSYIEREYDYATAQHKPFFAAIINEKSLDAKVKLHGIEATEKLNGQLLKSFREKVGAKTSGFFDDPKDLKLIIIQSLLDFERNEKLTGWVRGSEVVDPKTTLEGMSRLQTENESLRNELVELRARFALPQSAMNEVYATELLTGDAKKILLDMKNSGGVLALLAEGAYMHLGRASPTRFPNHREQARWKSAIDELLAPGFIELVKQNGDGMFFHLSKRGYEAADEIEASLKEATTTAVSTQLEDRKGT